MHPRLLLYLNTNFFNIVGQKDMEMLKEDFALNFEASDSFYSVHSSMMISPVSNLLESLNKFY